MEEFRFGSKKEYEAELKKLLSFSKSRKKRKGGELPGYDLTKLDEEYDKLVDEYVKFCTRNDV